MNPSDGKFTLVYPEEIIEYKNVKVRVVNIQGKIVHRIALDGSGRQKLDLSSLPEGLFVLEIFDAQEVIYQGRLAIIH